MYSALWTLGLGTWAAIFWALRRRAGPVTFVERQIAHLWAASMLGIALLFLVETLLQLPVLKLSPVLGLMNGMVFLAKAGMLNGAFYFQAAALFATAAAMALFPSVAISIFGLVSAAGAAGACSSARSAARGRKRVMGRALVQGSNLRKAASCGSPFGFWTKSVNSLKSP